MGDPERLRKEVEALLLVEGKPTPLDLLAREYLRQGDVSAIQALCVTVREQIWRWSTAQGRLHEVLTTASIIAGTDEDLEALKRSLKGRYKFTPLDRTGRVYGLTQFVEGCLAGLFTDVDGEGYYATATHVSDVAAVPSHIVQNEVRNEFTHVVWYNT